MDPCLTEGLKKAGVATAEKHLFLCLGPDCCPLEEGEKTWTYLKSAVRDLPVMRTKAACLRVCSGGPWLVIYPEGVWYGGVTVERCRRIVQEHLREGRPIPEWITIIHPLPSD